MSEEKKNGCFARLTPKTEYGRSVALALLTLFLTAVTTVGISKYTEWSERKQRSQALLCAYQAEVHSIKLILDRATFTTMAAYKGGYFRRQYEISYPRNIYDVTAGEIGIIADTSTVSKIVSLYSCIENVNEIARKIDQQFLTPAAGQEDYLFRLLATYRMCLLLDLYLTQQNGQILGDDEWIGTVDEAFARRWNATNPLWQQLTEKYKVSNIETILNTYSDTGSAR